MIRKVFSKNPDLRPNLVITINGVVYKAAVTSIPVDTSLNTFIRRHANLRGTKFMCLEGGCGVCIVAIRGFHPNTRQPFILAVNSCLLPVYSCNGMEVITVEALGNRRDGYHAIQSRLATFNGTQCGFCTPGWVMSMFALLEAERGELTMQEVENSFGGNLCRCTGYRSILDAFKSVTSDAPDRLRDVCGDIEDMPRICSKLLHKNFYVQFEEKNHFFKCASGREWHKPYNLTTLFLILKQTRQRSYMLVAGNTAHGVYRRSPNIEIFIDITSIEELRSHSIEGAFLEFGGSMTLTEVMLFLQRASSGRPQFEYVQELVKHIEMVAHVAVRNIGTLAGNLMIKHEHPDFPSDLFVILETVGAILIIAENDTKSKPVLVANFLKMDMNRKVIVKIRLPPLEPKRDVVKTFKIMPRAQNAHAYVNAGFLFRFNDRRSRLLSIRICYGGIHPRFIHAARTERILQGVDIFDNNVLQRAFESLDEEIQPDTSIDEPVPEHRKMLAFGLFYKAVLCVAPADRVQERYRSGALMLERPISSGIQMYSSNAENYPLTQPILKDTAIEQTSGEIEYVNDMPHMREDLWASFVLATQINCRICQIDPSPALKMSGVVAFFKASDIPGINHFTSLQNDLVVENEEIFASTEVRYHGQPLGIIVAESFETAQLAAKKVRVEYETMSNCKIFLTPHDVLEANAEDRIQLSGILGNPISIPVEGEHSISGKLILGSQFHFYMESQTCICVPSNQGGMDVYSATQWMDLVQVGIAQALAINESQIKMKVSRLGGGFGGKMFRASQIACATALASHLLNRTVRFVMTIEQNMMAIGKRVASESEYEVTTDANGKILRLENMIYEDFGVAFNENVTGAILPLFSNGYNNSTWYWQHNLVRTDKAKNCMARSPGTMQLVAMIENIMEHIASVTNQDPLDVRLANMPEDTERRQFIMDFRTSTDFDSRRAEIDEFNCKNRCKKRGIAIVPMDYGIIYFGVRYALVSIHHGDGSVTITHGGIEMGQGINTKLAQVAAHVLGIDYTLVRVVPSYNFSSPNSIHSSASITTPTSAHAVQQACRILLDRIQPVRTTNPDLAWPELIQTAFEQDIDLAAIYMYKASDLVPYPVFGIACAEIELDVLTGNFLLTRVDILQDTGESINPLLDVGQIEGAFIMGLGYWLHEKLIYNPNNGKLVTNRTWNYKIPGAKDIPVDFRISFMQNHNLNDGILRAKSVGEPTIALSVVVLFAIRYALNSARSDAGIAKRWFHMGAPCTIEEILLLTGNKTSDFRL